MPITAHLLAEGPGWRVDDVICTAGPRDRPFEERHDGICIAAVTAGTFQYRSTAGAAVLAPGAILLGGDGHCFECGHEHATGDRCFSLHLAPSLLEQVAAAVPGGRARAFAVPHLPPSPALSPLIAAAVVARISGDAAEIEELALRLAGAVLTAIAGSGPGRRAPGRRDAQRITDALRRIEAEPAEPMALADLARGAAMSRYHFLRVFRHVVGMTPHQFILQTRLHRAAVRLRQSDASIVTVAFDAGFNDVSTFNGRFLRVMGVTPGAYRAGRRRG